MTQKAKIGELACGAYHPIYRRSDGTTWVRLNERSHAPAENYGDYWGCAGATSDFDPQEEVEVIHLASEEKA
jgi:hypothetical protein